MEKTSTTDLFIRILCCIAISLMYFTHITYLMKMVLKWQNQFFSHVRFCCLLCVLLFVVWNKRRSSRTTTSHSRSGAATKPGTHTLLSSVFLSVILSLFLCFFLSFVLSFLWTPLWCSTDRRHLFILPLCRPAVLGERMKTLSHSLWNSLCLSLYTSQVTVTVLFLIGTLLFGNYFRQLMS